MKPIVFDGREFARKREEVLATAIKDYKLEPRIGALICEEDKASLMYSRIKKQAAVRVGVEFSEQLVSIKEPVQVLQDRIRVYADRDDVDGVLVQKPMKETWERELGLGDSEDFEAWWRRLILALPPEKDVDCLTTKNLQKVFDGKWQIVPATVKAVISVLVYADKEHGLLSGALEDFDLMGHNFVVVGRSDLIGKPLSAVLRQYGANVAMFGKDLDLKKLKEADVVVSATGKPGLITGEMIKDGAVVIDVGAPRGDVEFESVRDKCRFITPVPGGVGPVTVVSLLENLVEMVG